MTEQFARKNIRLPALNYRGSGRFFITLCCERRRAILARPEFANRVIEILRDTATQNGFAVYAYCLMPDHMHALLEGLHSSSDLLRFVRNFKRKTTAAFRAHAPQTLWQKKFYDHILRPNDSSDRVAAYIWLNPVRKELCKDACDYPYAGSFVLEWKTVPRPVDRGCRRAKTPRLCSGRSRVSGNGHLSALWHLSVLWPPFRRQSERALFCSSTALGSVPARGLYPACPDSVGNLYRPAGRGGPAHARSAGMEPGASAGMGICGLVAAVPASAGTGICGPVASVPTPVGTDVLSLPPFQEARATGNTSPAFGPPMARPQMIPA